jgi:hypothetical protein
MVMMLLVGGCHTYFKHPSGNEPLHGVPMVEYFLDLSRCGGKHRPSYGRLVQELTSTSFSSRRYHNPVADSLVLFKQPTAGLGFLSSCMYVCRDCTAELEDYISSNLFERSQRRSRQRLRSINLAGTRWPCRGGTRVMNPAFSIAVIYGLLLLGDFRS